MDVRQIDSGTVYWSITDIKKYKRYYAQAAELREYLAPMPIPHTPSKGFRSIAETAGFRGGCTIAP